MRVLIVGPGAVGRFLAARMALAQIPVALLDHRPERVGQIQRHGIELTAIDGRQEQVRCDVLLAGSGSEDSTPPFDIALSCVKSYDTEVAALQAAPFLRRDAVIVPLSNGLGNVEAVGQHWPAAQVAAGTHAFGLLAAGDHAVQQTGTGFFELAAPHDAVSAQERLPVLVDLLQQAQLQAELAPDYGKMLWQKAAVNCVINPIAALLQIPNGALLQLPLEPTMRAICGELVEVSHCEGIALELDHLFARVVGVCTATATNRCSTLVDLQMGRRTEIESLNGEVARRAEQARIPVPLNSLLTVLVRQRECDVQAG
ncbi:MAG: ketopantoate reductase family protein [Planctomycetota bacterium]